VSCNKFVAKIASDLNKPNGISVIEPDQVEEFIAALPIGKFHGVGRVTEKKMLGLNIKTGADLRNCSRSWLIEHFGKHGLFYYQIVRGSDPRPVQPVRIRKSVGAEHTLKEDTRDMAEITQLLNSLAEKVSQTLLGRALTAQTLTLKVRYSDFTTISRSISFKKPVSQRNDLLHHIPGLLDRTEAGARPIRLLGITASNLISETPSGPYQLLIPFDDQRS
jgi:DNA polymerase-4